MKRSGCLVVAFVLCGLVPPNLLAIDQSTVEMRTKQLKSMSKVDRDRLDRNIQEFKELTPDQQLQYRHLHDDLAADRKESGGLSSLMETYSLWLHTLTPTQREELQKESDTAKKLVIVRRIKEELDRPVEHGEPHHEESVPPAGPKGPLKNAFEKKDLDAVITVIVDSLPQDQRKPEFDQPSLTTYLPILNASLHGLANEKEWPDENLLPRIVATLRKEVLKDVQKTTGTRRDAIIRMMLTGIIKQARKSIQEPTEEDRIQTTLALTAAEHAQISKLPGEQVKWAIRRKFFESKGEEAVKQLKNVAIYNSQVLNMFDRLGVELPPGLNRPNLMRDRPPRGKGGQGGPS